MRRLRLLLVENGWSSVDDHGVPFVLSPDGKAAITTASGNHDTANPQRSPKTKFPKGAVAIALARQNRVQYDLPAAGFEAMSPATLTRIPDDATTYYLLVARRGGELAAELSVPVALDDQGYASVWTPRIILGKFSIGEPALAPESQPESIIDVDVSPRAGF